MDSYLPEPINDGIEREAALPAGGEVGHIDVFVTEKTRKEKQQPSHAETKKKKKLKNVTHLTKSRPSSLER